MNFSLTKLTAIFVILSSGIFCIASESVVDRIVAVVNSEIITLSDLNSYRTRLRKGTLIDQSLIGPRGTQKVLSSHRNTLNHLIDQKIIDAEVKRLGLSPSNAQVEKEIQNIARRGQISKDQLKQEVQQQGLSFSAYKMFLKNSIGRQALVQQQISPRIKISEADLKTYMSDGNSYTTAYTVAHIYFSPTKKGGSEAAFKRAQKVRKKINTSNFNKMVKKYSEEEPPDPSGLLGTFQAGNMLPNLEKALTKVASGHLAQGVIKGPEGFHIIKLIKKSRVKATANQNRKRAQAKLSQKTFQLYLKDWLKKKRAGSVISIKKI